MSHNERSQALTQLGLALVLVLCSCAASSLAAPPAPGESKVKLGVFMESLCPDTRRFFLDQLVPTHRQVGQVMDLQLVPFGHARVLPDNKMVCQHGSRECEGNRRMACLLARSRNQTEAVETLGCIFRGEQSPKDCCRAHMPAVNFDEVEECTDGDESHQLMKRAEKDTGRVGYVPHLTLGGQWCEDVQRRAEHHLLELVCTQYKGAKPLAPCRHGGAQHSSDQ